MRGTGILPPGRAGLIVIAAVVGSVILQRSKPLARKLGEGLEHLGRKLQAEAAEPASESVPPEEVPTEPNSQTSAPEPPSAEPEPEAEPAAEPEPEVSPDEENPQPSNE